MDLGAALLGLATGVVIKGLVMILGARFLLRLYRTSGADGAPRRRWLLVPAAERRRFRALTWGLAFFFVSELTCGIEVYILSRSDLYISCVHSITSALAMALTAIGIFEVMDWKYLHWKDASKACLAAGTCRGCTKRTDGHCKFRPLLLMSATLVAFMVLPVFFVSTAQIDADPRPYALPFESWNAWYDQSFSPWLVANFPGTTNLEGRAFYLPSGMLFLEFRILPLVGIGLATSSIATMLLGRENLAMALFLAALGVVAYAMFEAVIYGLTRDPIFGALIHEGGELMFLVMATDLLRRMFGAATEGAGAGGASRAGDPAAVG